MSERRTGRCLCGEVTVSINAEHTVVDACHCSMCRNWGGGPFLGVECRDGVEISGEEKVSVFKSSDWAERGFCRQCGTHLYYHLKNSNHYALPVGLFSDDASWQFKMQIFIDEKPAFYAFANETKNLTGAEVFALFNA